jgi:hypothetical protein
MKVALVAEGIIRNITETHLGIGVKDRKGVDQTYPYPMGQHFRGFFGYVLDDFGSKLQESWKKDAKGLVYFKDGLVRHQCGGWLYPIVVEKKFQNYECVQCKQKLKFATRVEMVVSTKIDRTTGRAYLYRMNCITGRHEFRFKAVLNLKHGKDFEKDFVAMIRYAEEEGIRLGRRSRKGKGRFVLDNVKFYYISLSDIKRRAKELAKRDEITIHFVSDLVSPELTGEVIVRGARNAVKFFHPEYESYGDPYCKVLWKEHLPSTTRVFLDFKDRPLMTPEKVIPAGAKVRIQFANTCDLFYEGLAIAEMLKGVGKRNTFGKGEFRILGLSA